MSGFFRALPVVLGLEGGYVHDEDDKGGATNHGVTQATYDGYRDDQELPRRPVKQITDDEVQAVYHKRYWVAGKCDALPWPLSLAHFDASVNHGLARSAKLLQLALGVKDDGVIGPITLAAVDTSDVDGLINELLWRRVDLYYRISKGSQLKFLRGWLRRLLHLRKEVA